MLLLPEVQRTPQRNKEEVVSQCRSGKIKYVTHALALQALYQMQSAPRPGHKVPIRVYYCHQCEGFHLTSQPKDALRFKKGIADFLWFLNQIL